MLPTCNAYDTLSFTRLDHITNSGVLEGAWPCPKNDDLTPKELLYDELVQGKRPVGQPKLCCNDVTKRDMLDISLPTDSWDALTSAQTA